MMSSFRAVFRKEMLHVRRNKAVAYLAVMMPLMQMTMYGFIDQTVHDEPTVIVGTNGPRGVPHLMPVWFVMRGTEVWMLAITR